MGRLKRTHEGATFIHGNPRRVKLRRWWLRRWNSAAASARPRVPPAFPLRSLCVPRQESQRGPTFVYSSQTSPKNNRMPSSFFVSCSRISFTACQLCSVILRTVRS